MLTPNQKLIDDHLKTLEVIWCELEPKDEIAKSLLNDALKEKYLGGIYATVQQRLITLNVAQKHIEQAIAALQNYKSLT